MTQAECEIVANVGAGMRELRDRLRIGWASERYPEYVGQAMNDLSYFIGALSALPLDVEDNA